MTPMPPGSATEPTIAAPVKTSPLISRRFTKEGVHPYSEITWVKRDAIVGPADRPVFEQKDVEFPDFWSDNAVSITVSKYFRGKLGTPVREVSLRQTIDRVVRTIRNWGESFGYFADSRAADIFTDELTHLLLYQKASFNSPVWFNVGTTPHPQCSACFILSVEDNMPSILDWIKTEGMIFKGGSGSGLNLSNLRSKHESLSGGGRASGPVSFMRGADSVAGMIKSGGTTRRAAKMVVLNIDHPDIMDFINCKVNEEKKIKALVAAGFNMADLNDEAWNSIQFQNANNSVRLTDEFMRAVEEDGDWQTTLLTGGAGPVYKARDLLHSIARAAWECGDPGVQFDTIINDWHTCPATGRINASNPCSEYMHLDDSACNLASINLMKFIGADGRFKVPDFKQAVDVFILAQDILVEGSSYPTERITKNARAFRELGLGYSNMGALIMAKGYAYDSDEGRTLAAAITSLLTGEGYRMSAVLSQTIGPFTGFAVNREPMLRVIAKHGAAAHDIDASVLSDRELSSSAARVWDEALALSEKHGFRNSQTTVIAPTGTISFMMDCDTTGVEPAFSLVTMKQLVGGGWMKLVIQGLKRALANLGYSSQETEAIVAWVTDKNTIEGAPYLKEEHLSIFDCAVAPANGSRSISWQGHVRMVGAVQPFVSGAISKTFNMSHDATVEDILNAYTMAWHLGIKAFAVYRDGSKSTQPLNVSGEKKDAGSESAAPASVGAPPAPFRRRLPTTRPSETHKLSIAGHEGYLTYSMYEDGAPAEIFIRMAKQGSTLSGLLDAFAVTISISLQYGVPLKNLAEKFIHSRFEPAGFTENPQIRIATSIIDYIFRYLALRFLSSSDLSDFGMAPLLNNSAHDTNPAPAASPIDAPISSASHPTSTPNSSAVFVSAGTVCKKCGGMMIRTGTCQTCLSCGTSSGGCS